MSCRYVPNYSMAGGLATFGSDPDLVSCRGGSALPFSQKVAQLGIGLALPKPAQPSQQ